MLFIGKPKRRSSMISDCQKAVCKYNSISIYSCVKYILICEHTGVQTDRQLTDKQSQIQMYRHTVARDDTHTCKYTCMLAFICTYMRTYVHTHIHVCIQKYRRTYKNTYIHTVSHTHTCKHTLPAYTHNCIHTCIHTYMPRDFGQVGKYKWLRMNGRTESKKSFLTHDTQFC